ncbi:sister chromatid cohesion 1 protein 3 [Daucus carota subsp. sativus]|uniref:sister chromatid cohesion 1 protein 3 n=1 Tax=Daucus carota subsp. sativus TaxID=79200 RepID=UPI0007B22B29|nr:PREDICTED: sister chromatid cohesion 1 protein 3 [Daucus carota subsp. sativus]XP_017245213.1 PREDICTED: sister chromatid cohesion 1 protein 3 [Daucus carota subsp. sativus]
MFYSNTFLARKGPLGTVWCAAHLQNRLKKSHITATNVARTVERIMYPELPIALRMSGHLLLGVVRIYSKQVDYFCQDCKVLLFGVKKAYTSTNVNLPENATHATLESITLPDNFQLDVMDLDDNFDSERFHDKHLRSREEITIEDQIPIGQDPYIVVSFNEDVSNSNSETGYQPMHEDTRLRTPVSTSVGVQDPGPSNQAGLEDISTRSMPDIEVMRDADPETEVMRDAFPHPEDIPSWIDPKDDKLEPDIAVMDEVMNEQDNHTPNVEFNLSDGSRPTERREEPISAALEQEPANSGSHNVTVDEHVTPEMALRSSPPAEQPNRRPKRRRVRFDEVTVLSNKVMKQRLDDSSKIVRTKKQCYRLKFDGIFSAPIHTGLCNDLRDALNNDFVSSKPYLASVEESSPAVAESSRAVHDTPDEIERLRNNEIPTESNILHDLMNSPSRIVPSPTKSMSSPTGRDDNPSAFDPESAWTNPMETTIGTVSDRGASTGRLGSDMETPLTMLNEQSGFENTCLSDIPELMNSRDGELSFLAEDDHTPAGTQGTPDYFTRQRSGASEVDMLSVRSRAVAKFLKSKLSVTPISERQSEDLSLNKILEGKRRKISARMVFETLVLKNCGLVDLQQEEPYGEITLKLMPKLAKDQSLS